MRYVFIRNKTYYFRITIPQNLIEFFPQGKFFITSLHTQSKITAQRYSKVFLDRFTYIKQSMKMAINRDKIQELVNELVNLRVEETETDLYNTHNPEDTMFAIQIDDQIANLKNSYGAKKYDTVQNDIDSIVIKLGSVDDNTKDEIGKVLLNAHINALKSIRENINAEVYKLPRAIIKAPTTTSIASTEQVAPVIQEEESLTLEEAFLIFKKYKSAEDDWSDSTLGLVETVEFVLFLILGKEIKIQDINKEVLIETISKIRKLPPQIKKSYSPYYEKDINYILDNPPDDGKYLSNNTVRKYIIRIEQLFKYLHENGYKKINVGKDLTPKKVKEAIQVAAIEGESKNPYPDDAIKEIYNTVIEMNSNKVDIEFKYFTLLTMYGGLIPSEIARLRPQDIGEENGVIFFSINREDGKATKTVNRIRKVPMHKKIIENGFLDFLKESKGKNVFTTDTSAYTTRFNKRVFKHINERYEELELTYYSLRHAFIDRMKINQERMEYISEISGHEKTHKTTNNYGNKTLIEYLSEVVNRIDHGV